MQHIDETIAVLRKEIAQMEETVSCLVMLNRRISPPDIGVEAPERRPITVPKAIEPAPVPVRKNLKPKPVQAKAGPQKRGTEIAKLRAALLKIQQPFDTDLLATVAGTNKKTTENFLYRERLGGAVIEAGKDGAKKLFARKDYIAPTAAGKKPTYNDYEQQKRELGITGLKKGEQ